ncbi:hypothetical protein M972_112614 [Acetivibrio thermocellus AD2]|jgi:hypothetical protein|uniref:Uncharacterized protein n=1 Tax=Acetivibrio thermocellus AD2 TaxID=1138384 RepID=A0AB36TJW6_ACETH|nr:hypothetical protein AD2_02537 [Acetivibrio thermocellus AD2]ANV77291.1 hypothetical protein LQRI_2550 [Acetivibrio thermocellus DSM 2360]EIC04498.1 hypothetical protein YSBL_1829 [Acetivibrio thermocellus YS]CDG36359.1 hypothetical protein CTHBC1_1731 [Acetivibrio thermocellus BC1]SOD23165.1 hypothetical protein SAMN04515622_0981 [Acetivibrio thermocellus]
MKLNTFLKKIIKKIIKENKVISLYVNKDYSKMEGLK